MKTYSKFFGLLLTSAMIGGGLSSCISDDPFSPDAEGTLRMQMVINSDVTRAATDDETLYSKCVVYISGSEGLLYKYQDLSTLPDIIPMKTGHYVAEAWTGDSVPASFDKKFFRGYQPFEVVKGENQVVVNCRIANSVVSVNPTTIHPELMTDWTITVSNNGEALTFNEENVATDKAYFMMSSQVKDLDYTIVGNTVDGHPFTKKGKIRNAQRAHEYILNLAYNPEYDGEGGAYLQVVIDDTEIKVNSTVDILSGPLMKGEDFELDDQVYAEPGEFPADRVVKVLGFNGLKELWIESDDWQAMKLPVRSFNIRNITASSTSNINAAGVKWEYGIGENGIAGAFIYFSQGFLNALPKRNTEYVVKLRATDLQGKTAEGSLRIAVGEDAIVIKDPVVVESVADAGDLLAVRSRSVTLPVKIANAEASNPGVQYRADGETEWQFAPVNASRASVTGSIVLTGLKPSTRYEYRAAADGFEGESMYFTTESIFTIPNASMEDWSDWTENSKILIPSGDGNRSFWDSGNHGSSTMSVTLTQGSEDMKHNGTRSARLRSQFVGLGGFAGKFAAGNLFAGTYLETQGTDGRLEFGRPYDGSHPSALSLWVNYRPGKVEKKGDYLAVGDMDKGQIYVALSTEPVEVRTKASTRKLFNKDDDCIVAYGQYTFEGNYGADGVLQHLEIPIEYYTKAKTVKPLYLIIVCSASYYGDYFNGGEGSLMYVDDFELVYE